MTKTKDKISPKLYKIIFQARYKPHLRFYNMLYDIGQKFENFPHWETDGLSLVLKDFEKRCSLGIRHDNFSYDQDSDSISQADSNLKTVLEILPKYLEIDSYFRLGLRKKFLAPVKMSFQELVGILYLKLFSQDECLNKITPEIVYDLQYVIDSSENNLRYHIRLGPVEKKEIPRHMGLNKRHHFDPITEQKDYEEIINSYPELAVFMDIDVFQSEDEIAVTDGNIFLKDAKQRINKLVEGLIAYIFNI